MGTYITLYKPRSKYTTLYLVICLAISLVGAVGLVMALVWDKALIPMFNEGSYIVLLGNGMGSFFIVRDSAKKAKYYVAWNEEEITFLLPKSKQPETIKLDDITSVEMGSTKILIGLRDNTVKEFGVFYFFYPERQRVKDFFEGLNEKLSA